ncbi:MAG: fructose-bisphosphatase class II [Candidatus Levybacteria bacterium]|nr:fructose-bisphosphatase class II [Candidatus Levybacteria bacterium]
MVTKAKQKNESYDRKLVEKHITDALHAAAITASIHIENFTQGKEEKTDLPLDVKKARVKKIDTDADGAFQNILKQSSVEFHGIDAEGGKEAHPDKLGEAMPLSIGVFGKGDTKATFVLDVVEGTTAAAHNRPDAISIAGVSSYNSVQKIPINPKTGQGYNYFRKLFAPPEFSNHLSLEKSALENLQTVLDIANIKPKRMRVVAMNRKSNEDILLAAKKLGANLTLLQAGDLAWCLKALLSDPEEPILVLGRGGAEEGSIAQIAAHALHGTGQLQAMMEERDIKSTDTTPIWNPTDYIKGDAKHSLVVFSSITKGDHFGMHAVKTFSEEKDSGYMIDTMVIDSNGAKRKTHKVSYKFY